ncbi:MAG: PEP-CTERM sorting domain-containing protein [Chthoniobacter sp.]|nr:PEP-CTERM sorting domain-containing protein [Chthoniobacter sp.]
MHTFAHLKLKLAVASVLGLLISKYTAKADLLVYEGFDYASGGTVNLAGQGTNTNGLTGTWSTFNTGAAAIKVYNQGSTSGTDITTGVPNTYNGTVPNLPTSGGYFGMGGTNTTDHMIAWRSLAPSVTATFTDGSSTWFSFASVRGFSANPAGMKLALGKGALIEDRGGRASGEAIGGGGGLGSSVKNGYKVYPQFWDNTTGSPGETLGTFSNYDVGGIQPGSASDHAVSAPYTLVGSGNPNNLTVPSGNADGLNSMLLNWANPSGAPNTGAANIIIGKIEWHTGSPDVIKIATFQQTDTMTEAAFDAFITAQPNLSSANWAGIKPDLDQSQFDTISLAGGKWFADEIRLATTFSDVITGTSVVPEPSSLGLLALGGLALLLRRRTA